ncbi:hypothetical protein BDN70DRAFT_816988 [Pholiota conissans]|uniref:DUF6589 domain-containing protein n=1 Tax=Pholiota conissans TaxID=109636 RepID=A0A9P5YQK8_9AGAR|nr:hypothetical protein BDN70DRAFT_816988 [Pholiota conissans]
MRAEDLKLAFTNAPPLLIQDVLLSRAESLSLNENLLHCALSIIITHGGEGFQKFRRNLQESAPSTEYKVDLHQTPLHPLPAFDIDESTIVGGAEVIDAIF